MCVGLVDLTTLQKPHIMEDLINRINVASNSLYNCRKNLGNISHLSISNAGNIRGQAYDGTAVMSSEIASV